MKLLSAKFKEILLSHPEAPKSHLRQHDELKRAHFG